MTRTQKEQKRYQRVLSIIKRWRLLDDEFMKRCLKDNKPAVECILRIIMDKADLVVQSIVIEDTIPNLQGRGVRLDVHATDQTGREYDIEVQRADTGATAKRARFNSSLLDLNSLKKGDNFENLPETYVIFITENDVLGGGKAKYHIDRVIHEMKKLFGDEEHIIFVNGAYKGDDDIGKLMHDFRSSNPDDMLLEPLKETVNRYKNNTEEVIRMSKDLEDLLNEEVNEARAEGEEKANMSSIRAIMETAGVTAEKAMEMLKIDKSLWQKYLALL